jgi:DNA mismatch repair protein MutS2
VQIVAEERAPQLELKVIGLSVEEALEKVDRFLDEALLHGTPWVRIVHGRGTGALRRAISSRLSELPFVSKWNPADAASGGEAVTVVEFSG